MERNTTGPLYCRPPDAHSSGGWPACPPAVLQMTDDDRHQRAKQYWPIRRASNKIYYPQKTWILLSQPFMKVWTDIFGFFGMQQPSSTLNCTSCWRHQTSNFVYST